MWRSRYVTDHVMWRFTLCDISCYVTIMLCDAHIMWHHVWCNHVMKLSRYVTITLCNLTLCSCTQVYSAIGIWAVMCHKESIRLCRDYSAEWICSKSIPIPCPCPCPCPCLCCPCPFPCLLPCPCQFKYGTMNFSVRQCNYIVDPKLGASPYKESPIACYHYQPSPSRWTDPLK